MTVGISRDTAQFAGERMRRWWDTMGKPRYPQAHDLLLTADGGGRNGYRTRLGKVAGPRLATAVQLAMRGCHCPPGTSKWNKSAPRMCSVLSQNWRGRPVDSLAPIVNLIATPTTDTGLYIETSLDDTVYETGIEGADRELASLPITREKFHGEWNYVIKPSI